jgi:hypothetical protein
MLVKRLGVALVLASVGSGAAAGCNAVLGNEEGRLYVSEEAGGTTDSSEHVEDATIPDGFAAQDLDSGRAEGAALEATTLPVANAAGTTHASEGGNDATEDDGAAFDGRFESSADGREDAGPDAMSGGDANPGQDGPAESGFTEFPSTGGGPYGITSGPDGNLWFTELRGNQIGRITTAGTLTEFSRSDGKL